MRLNIVVSIGYSVYVALEDVLKLIIYLQLMQKLFLLTLVEEWTPQKMEESFDTKVKSDSETRLFMPSESESSHPRVHPRLHEHVLVSYIAPCMLSSVSFPWCSLQFSVIALVCVWLITDTDMHGYSDIMFACCTCLHPMTIVHYIPLYLTCTCSVLSR